jgi:hypothetical protein
MAVNTLGGIAVSGAVAAGRRRMTDRVYRGLVTACGALLLAFGGLCVWKGLHDLFR